jgi:hypothetical protein
MLLYVLSIDNATPIKTIVECDYLLGEMKYENTYE